LHMIYKDFRPATLAVGLKQRSWYDLRPLWRKWMVPLGHNAEHAYDVIVVFCRPNSIKNLVNK
jgi:hypothetical protein